MKSVTLPNGHVITDVPDDVDEATIYAKALDKGLFKPKHTTEKSIEEFQANQSNLGESLEQSRQNTLEAIPAFVRGASYGLSDLAGTESPISDMGRVAQFAGSMVSPLGKLGVGLGEALGAKLVANSPTLAKYLGNSLGGLFSGAGAGFGLSSADTFKGRAEDAALTGLGAAALTPALSGVGALGVKGYNTFVSPKAQYLLTNMLNKSGVKMSGLQGAGTRLPLEIDPTASGMLGSVVAKEPSVGKQALTNLANRKLGVSQEFSESMQSNVGRLAKRENQFIRKINPLVEKAKKGFDDLIGKQVQLPEAELARQLHLTSGSKVEELANTSIKLLNSEGVPVTSVIDLPVLQKMHSLASKATRNKSDASNYWMLPVKNTTAKFLNQASPGYAKANEAWAVKSAMERAKESGRKVFTASPSELKKDMAKMTREEKTAFRTGASAAVEDELGAKIPAKFNSNKFKKNIDTVFPKKEASRMEKAVEKHTGTLRTLGKAEGTVESGLTSAGALTGVEPVPGTPHHFVYKESMLHRGPNKAEAQKIMENLTSPGMKLYKTLEDYTQYPVVPSNVIGGLLGAMNQ